MGFLTFKQFLLEKFLRGVATQTGYTEIYELDPSDDDRLRREEGLDSAVIGEVLTLNDHDPKKQIGGWLFDNTMYVWDRNAATHEQIRHELRKPTMNAWPFYLQYDFKQKLVTVTLGLWSLDHMGVQTYDPKRLETMFANHPAIKKLSHGGRFVFREV